MLILNSQGVIRSIPMSQAVDAMKQAFAALYIGQAKMPPRTVMGIENHNALSLIMPSYSGGDQESLTVKVVGIFPNNLEKGLDRILGAVMVFDPSTGAPQAILDGATLTGIRTAAASAAATDFLARQDSRSLAVIGAGVQARTHIDAMCAVRPVESLRLFSRTKANAEKLAAEIRDHSLDVEVFDSADQAVEGADIVCCVSSASRDVFSEQAIASGTHINAVGSSTLDAWEVPANIVTRSIVVVDQREAAWEEAGDIMQPIADGLITKDHVVAELGELSSGSLSSPRTDDQQITFFKSVGLAIQDTFAASLCVRNAIEQGIGHNVDF